ELLVTALPELRERLAEDRLRRTWAATVGEEIARRARPRRLAHGCLEVVVDNSPWLSELTLRSSELVARIAARHAEVRSVKLVLGPLEPATTAPARPAPPRPRALGRDERRAIEETVAVIADEEVRAAARRLLARARSAVAPAVLLAVLLLAGCAARTTVAGTAGSETPPTTRRM